MITHTLIQPKLYLTLNGRGYKKLAYVDHLTNRFYPIYHPKLDAMLSGRLIVWLLKCVYANPSHFLFRTSIWHHPQPDCLSMASLRFMVLEIILIRPIMP